VLLLTHALARITADESVRLLLSKAQAIDQLETTLGPWLSQLAPGLHPPYLHVLRANPTALGEARLERIWSGQGAGAGADASRVEAEQHPPLLQQCGL
jgi:hypothetical protein